MLHSIVEYYADQERHKCGYCKSPDTNFSYGMWAHSLTVGDYQDLIDRGWRRSGRYCYKPTMDVTCCPMYTIRCHSQEFKATKSQKKVFKKFNKFLMTKDVIEHNEMAGDASRKMSTSSSSEDLMEYGGSEQFVESTQSHQDIDVDNIVKSIVDEPGEFKVDDSPIEETPKQHSRTQMSPKIINKDLKKGVGADPNKAPCKKAKQLRLERKLEKLKEMGIDVNTLSNNNKNKEKQIEDFIDELPQDIKQRLQIRLVRTNPPSPEWLATAKETHDVYVKYQTTIHGDKPEKCTESKFMDFLVQSPLLEEHTATSPPCGYGSFHQQYWLDGNIIAVGVIDILPKSVSSVYFFYDPQYINLTLGTYGALREIAFTRHLNSQCPELKYYYMGYYIHSCRKMRYKGNFCPSYLLCPETYKWFPIRDAIQKLEMSPYSRLDPDIDSTDENYPSETDINYIPVLVQRVVLPYKMYKRKFGSKRKDDSKELMDYARLVGRVTAKSLILVR